MAIQGRFYVVGTRQSAIAGPLSVVGNKSLVQRKQVGSNVLSKCTTTKLKRRNIRRGMERNVQALLKIINVSRRPSYVEFEAICCRAGVIDLQGEASRVFPGKSTPRRRIESAIQVDQCRKAAGKSLGV
jgi:hypothetical protein